nr:hypothetical protein HK105_003451 [Polyrhizophydium stewartii]
MGEYAFREIMAEFAHAVLPAHHPYTVLVQRIANRLIQASGLRDSGWKWEVFVINDAQRNAFVLPGGKIFVFTGILPVVENEDGLASVLGHEAIHPAQIAHQVARHSAEKLSWAKLLMFVQFLVSVVLMADPGPLFRGLILDLGIMRPFSRKCESEADFIGLQIMARACYDPHESVRMWERMSAAERGERQPPKFLNTHPSHESRIQNIQEWMPKAMQTREEAGCAQTGTFAQMFFDKLRLR